MRERCNKLFFYQWQHEEWKRFLSFPVNVSALENVKEMTTQNILLLFRTNLCLDITSWSAPVRILINIIIYRCRYFVISTASENTSEIAVYVLTKLNIFFLNCWHNCLQVRSKSSSNSRPLIWEPFNLSVRVLPRNAVLPHR